MKLLHITLPTLLVAVFSATASMAGSGEILTWQNSAGKWWACGPIQCLWASENSETIAIRRVINDQRMQYHYEGPFGRCHRYSVRGVESYDYSTEWVRAHAKCN